MTFDDRFRHQQAQDQALEQALTKLGISLDRGPEWQVVLALLRGGWPGTPSRADELAYLTFLADHQPGDIARGLREAAQKGQKYRPTPAELRAQLPPPQPQYETTTKTTEDWTTILTATLERLHPGAESWLTPLQLLGELENWLIVDTEPRIQTWVERRYLSILNETAIAHHRAGIRFHTQITLPAPPPRRRLHPG